MLSEVQKDGQKRSAYRVIGHVEFLAAPRSSGAESETAEDWRSEVPNDVAF